MGKTTTFTVLVIAIIKLSVGSPVGLDLNLFNELAKHARIQSQYGNSAGEYDFNTMCFACKSFVESLDLLWNQTSTAECALEVMIAACEQYKISDSFICANMVNEFKDELLYVFGKLVLHPNNTCALLVDHCGPTAALTSNWTIDIPNNKPKVVPLTPPKAGSSTLRVLHLADIHLDSDYKVGSEASCGEPLCCRNTPKTVKQPAGTWGTVAKMCDLPVKTFENMLIHINQTHKDIDHIVWTGDFPPHNFWNYTKENHIKMLKDLTKYFEKYFPKIKVFSAVGNHEGVPSDSFAPHNLAPAKYLPTWLYSTLADEWTHFIPDDTKKDINFRASYATEAYPGLRYISINTQYCDKNNIWLYINQTDPDSTLSWLSSQLLDAEKKGDKVHLFGHTPSGDSYCFEHWSRNYYTIVNRFESTIRAQFYGHSHYDTFSVFYENLNPQSRPTNIMYVAPSVTTYGSIQHAVQPAYRIYTIDGNYNESTWMVLDTETYSTDLVKANQKDGKPEWALEYSAKKAYKMANLFPEDWSKVINNLKADPALFKQFVKFKYRMNDKTAADYKCDALCRYNELCGLRSGMPERDDQFCHDIKKSDAKALSEIVVQANIKLQQKLSILRKAPIKTFTFDKCQFSGPTVAPTKGMGNKNNISLFTLPLSLILLMLVRWM